MQRVQGVERIVKVRVTSAALEKDDTHMLSHPLILDVNLGILSIKKMTRILLLKLDCNSPSAVIGSWGVAYVKG